MRVKNFLKSDHSHHKDPQVRLERVRALDPHEGDNQTLLGEWAIDDDDLSVRLAAIGKLDNVAVLRQLLAANGDDMANLLSASENRLVQLLNSSLVDDSEIDNMLASHPEQLAVLIANHSAVARQRELSLALIVSESVLAQVVVQSRYHDTRLAASQRLTQHDTMRSVLAACRSRDKVVAKLLQHRLDERAQAEARLIDAQRSVSTTLAAMISLTESVWSPQTNGRFQALTSRWATLEASLRTGSEQIFVEASQRTRSLIDAHSIVHTDINDSPLEESSISDQTAADANVENLEVAEDSVLQPVIADDDLRALHEALSKVGLGSLPSAVSPYLRATPSPKPSTPDSASDSASDSAPDSAPDSASDLASDLASAPPSADANTAAGVGTPSLSGKPQQTLIAHAQSVAVLFDPPFDVAKARPGMLKQRIKRVEVLLDIDSIVAGLNMSGIDLARYDYVVELTGHLQILTARVDKAKQESTDRIKATHRQFGALSSTINDGKWGPANSMLKRLQKKISGMEPAERATLADKLLRAEKQLAEMADWQDFAARPKLETLCSTMEALPAKELPPATVAKEVKNLQAQWKAFGVSRASNDLWSRFKSAGDTAYEPCKFFFDEQQAERQKKLDNKKQLCDQLKKSADEIDWETANWHDVQRQVNNAKREWSRNRIPDRKPNRSLEQHFSDVLKPLEARLTEQYDANAEIKKELVEKAQKLAESEINQHSVNQAKRLQSAWKQVGIMRRKEDQILWDAFNLGCRAIFKHQHEAEREKYKASMGHVFRARDIIKALKQIAKNNSSDDSQVQQLSAEFQGLAEFPEKEKKFLLRDFRAALDACSRTQETQFRRKAKAEQEELHRLVGLCEQLETAAESSELATDTLRDDVIHAWESSDIMIAREIATRIVARRDAAMNHIEANTRFDYDANEAQRRELLIRMEIAAGIDTPAVDKPRRMQYQLAHLQEGMVSAGVADKRSELAVLELDWLTAPPAPSFVHDSLNSRFLKAVGR